MQPPVTVDPRYHDAVLFNLDGFGNQIVDGAPALDSMVELAQRLHHAGVATAAFSAGLHLHLRVSGKGAIISVDPRDSHGVEIEYRGRVRYLSPGTTTHFSDAIDF